MAHLYERSDTKSLYKDPKFDGSFDDYVKALKVSTTLYVGNLSFYTREEQIYELFVKVGPISRIVMGLDSRNRTPCGFCFVEYFDHATAERCVNWLNGTKLDGRIIRADWDTGFTPNRQFGRGKSGGQVRDEYRVDYDPERGGFGKIVLEATKGETTKGSGQPRSFDPLATQ